MYQATRRAFTLIELLIVVAIIAILAAIAVPNFLEAQVRSKISRTQADIRSLATAIEAYAVDNNKYPIDGAIVGDNQAFWYVPGGPTVAGGVAGVTSPIAYITSARLLDPFRTVAAASAAKAADAPDSNHFDEVDYRRYRYITYPYTYRAAAPPAMERYQAVYGDWSLSGSGPLSTYASDAGVTVPGVSGTATLMIIYDATNGTASRGNIVRSQKHTVHPGPHGLGF